MRMVSWLGKLEAFIALFVVGTGVAAHGLNNANGRRMVKPPGLPIVDVSDLVGPSTYASGLNRRADLPPYNTTYYFDQLIDHNDPSKGTFKQRYWHTAEFYKPGGPIIFMNAGEVNAAPYYGYVTNRTINGVIAQQYSGAAIVLEHRFFGLSNPYPNLNVASLKYLTVQQSIEDNVYFARNVVLPQANGNQVGPDKAPWIMFGGSYPGALVSWTMAAHPDVFWIGYASSAVVQVSIDFWQYFEPIRQNMPKNCSADVGAVVSYVDKVFTGTNTTAQRQLRSLFGMSSQSNAYVAGALRWDLWTWQDMQPDTGPGATFFRFCDALEVKDGVSAPLAGWGVDHALSAWSSWFASNQFVSKCESSDCLSEQSYTRGVPIPGPISESRDREYEVEKRADYPVDDPYRSWFWMVCNEIGFSLDGPPVGQGGIVSRLVVWQDNMRDCVSTYPEAFSTYPTPPVNSINTKYGGWSVKNKRLFFANGKQDPWREATVSAVNSTAVSSDDQPIRIGNGFHCSDLVMRLAAPDPTIVAVQNSFIGYVAKWLAQW